MLGVLVGNILAGTSHDAYIYLSMELINNMIIQHVCVCLQSNNAVKYIDSIDEVGRVEEERGGLDCPDMEKINVNGREGGNG